MQGESENQASINEQEYQENDVVVEDCEDDAPKNEFEGLEHDF